MRRKISKLMLLISLLSASCKTSKLDRDASSLMAFTAPDASNTAVVLVHGWGKVPRRPNFIWRLKIRPYTDLSALKEQLQSVGFSNVNILEYDDEQSLDEMAGTVAQKIQKIFLNSNNPNLKLDIIGHSLGQIVSLKALLEYPIHPTSSEKISSKVRLFVGLAGAARGQNIIRPCRIFPNQCGGAESLTPFYRGPHEGAETLKKLFTANFDAINKLKKCSLYSRHDEIVDDPYDAGSFRNLGFDSANIKDMEINYEGSKFHKDVKDSPSIIQAMLSGCYGMLQ